MDRLGEFLEIMKQQHQPGDFLGLLNILIGRSIKAADGTLLSRGITWREAAALLKKVRWPKDAVHELGIEPASLPLRNRMRFWNAAIARAGVSTPKACQSADRLAKRLKTAGYIIEAPTPETRMKDEG